MARLLPGGTKNDTCGPTRGTNFLSLTPPPPPYFAFTARILFHKTLRKSQLILPQLHKNVKALFSS